jgi:hypothetical protein
MWNPTTGQEVLSHTRTREGEETLSTPVEDVTALVEALMATIRTSAFDDMPWPEIDRALQLTSHQLKVQFMLHGTLDPSPGDNLPTGEAVEGQTATTTHKRKPSVF